MLVSLVSQKGGVGKTTIALNLAAALAIQRKQKILVVDGDVQGNLLQWLSISEKPFFDVVHRPEPEFYQAPIKALAKRYRHTIIDAPPGVTDATQSILLAVNLAIIPIGASTLDLWSAGESIALIREARAHNRKLRAKFLISKKVPGTVPEREVRKALEVYRMGIFKTEVAHRMAHVRAMMAGVSVIEYAPFSEAAREIISLSKEIK